MAEKVYKSRVKQQYEQEVVPYLVKKFAYKNMNEVPKLVKIVINAGLGDIKDNAKSVQIAHDELKAIAGQKPVITKAKKSVANFKVREGMNVGLKVTLRKDRMYDFYDKFVSIALPRVRDFRGPPIRSTAAATMRWASKSSSSSRKFLTTRSKRSAGTISASSPRRRRTKKRENCSGQWVCPSRNKERRTWLKNR